MKGYIELPFIEVHQPIGSFYITSIRYQDLITISFADIRKIDEEARDDDNFDTYLGIQRRVAPNRVKEITEYVSTLDATFPTSVILHIRSIEETLDGKSIFQFEDDQIDARHDEIKSIRNIILNRDNNRLYIREDEHVAQILDGQHRLEGLRQYQDSRNLFSSELTFDLNVTIFVDLDLDDQAQIFSIINKAQTKVNKSLVYDLYEYARYRSPQKTAHDIVRLLNRREDSPFYRKIKILGSAEDSEKETIAQATFAEAIIRHISKDPMKDRDDLRRGGFFRKVELQELPDSKYVFRRLFVLDKDEFIIKNLMNFFCAVSERWPKAWGIKSEGNILNKSTGLIVLMRLLKDIINDIKIYDEVIPQATFAEYLNKILINDGMFDKKEYVPGSSGQSNLYHMFVSFL